jgi:hypothetical protein
MTAKIINFDDHLARSLGFASMAALDAAYWAHVDAEVARDPQYQEWVKAQRPALEAVK